MSEKAKREKRKKETEEKRTENKKMGLPSLYLKEEKRIFLVVLLQQIKINRNKCWLICIIQVYKIAIPG